MASIIENLSIDATAAALVAVPLLALSSGLIVWATGDPATAHWIFVAGDRKSVV